jgi:hypothetical protein
MLPLVLHSQVLVVVVVAPIQMSAAMVAVE